MRKSLALALLLCCSAIPAYADGMNVPPPLFGQGIGDTSSATTPGVGHIGEVISASASSVALANATPTNIVSASVTAGHWSCGGNVGDSITAGSTNFFEGGVSLTTATLPATGSAGFGISPATSGTVNSVTVGPVYYNFTTTTTVYMVGEVSETGATQTAFANLSCQRIW